MCVTISVGELQINFFGMALHLLWLSATGGRVCTPNEATPLVPLWLSGY